MFRERRDVARGVEHADDDKLIITWRVVDGIVTVKGHPQARRKLIARRPEQRHVPQWLKFFLDRGHEARCNGFRRFERKPGPDFG